MHRLFVPLLALALAGCTTLQSFAPDVRVKAYAVKAIRIKHLVVFEADQKECAQAALDQADGFDPLGLASAAGEGIGNNAASFPISPWAPVAGGAGQLGSTALQQAGVSITGMIADKIKCTTELTRRDLSAVVTDSKG